MKLKDDDSKPENAMLKVIKRGMGTDIVTYYGDSKA